MVGALHQLDGRPGSQVAAADADDHKHVGGFPDPVRRQLDAVHFLGLLGLGQVQPAQEIVACAGTVGQGIVGRSHFLLQCQQVGQRNLTPDIRNINFDHNDRHVLS